MQVRKGLAFPISEDFFNAARSTKVQLDSRLIMKKIPGILDQLHLGYFETSMLIICLDDELVSHSSPNLIQQQELLNYLLAFNEEFLRIIVFFNRLVKKAESPYSIAGSLLEKLEVTYLDEVNHIKIAAEEAAKSIEDMLTVVWNQLFEKEDFLEESSFHDLVEHIGHTLEGASDSLEGLNRSKAVCSGQMHLNFLPQNFHYSYAAPDPEPTTLDLLPIFYQCHLSDLADEVNIMIDELTRQSDG